MQEFTPELHTPNRMAHCVSTVKHSAWTNSAYQDTNITYLSLLSQTMTSLKIPGSLLFLLFSLSVKGFTNSHISLKRIFYVNINSFFPYLSFIFNLSCLLTYSLNIFLNFQNISQFLNIFFNISKPSN